MKSIFLLLLAPLLFSCSSPVIPGPSSNLINDSLRIDTIAGVPIARRNYEVTRGGLQIVAIYFDQNANQQAGGSNNEWVVLQADKNLTTKGWRIDADDPGQVYYLPDTVYKTLTIYTKSEPGVPSPTSVSLDRNAWIWHNSDADTARIYNEQNKLVYSATYHAR